MDETDRKRSVEAGKKLLQRSIKKKGKSKKKKEDINLGDISADVSTSSILNESVNASGTNARDKTEANSSLVPNLNPGTSYGVGIDPLNFNESLENRNDPLVNNCDHQTVSVSFEPQQALSLSENQTSYNPANADKALDIPDGSSDRYFSSTPPEEHGLTMTFQGNSDLECRLRDSQDTVTQLQNEIITLKNERQQILHELNSLRETQFDTLEQTRREISSNYDLQVANLQQSLVDTERQLQNMEQQFIETKRVHDKDAERHLQELSERDQEYARLLNEINAKHTEILKDKDQKHAQHISRITSELSNHFAPPIIEKDSDEQEAERLKMIKEKMKELHDQEKSKLLSEHAQEKESLQADLLKKLEDYRLQAENAANSQIKTMYDQFVKAHKELEGKNATLEDRNATLEGRNATLEEVINKMSIESSELKAVLTTLQGEKASIEEQYQSLLHSHSSELECERKNSLTLEKKLKDWTEKASRLEAMLSSSENQSSVEIDRMNQEKEEAISQVSSSYESKLSTLQSQVENYQTQLHEIESRLQNEQKEREAQLEEEYLAKLRNSEEQTQKQIEEIVAKYEDELSKLKENHATQVDQLEASVSEFFGEKGSLEVAEEHMKSLQGQLNEYRNQEQNFKAQLVDLTSQHKDDLASLREQLTDEKQSEVERVRESLSSKIKVLKNELEVRKSSGDEEVIEALKEAYLKEIAELKLSSAAERDAATSELCFKLETAQREEIESLNQKRATEVESLRMSFEKEMEEAKEEIRRQVTDEMETAKLEHIQRLHMQYEVQISQLENSLSKIEGETRTKFTKKIESLQVQISELNEEKSKWESSKKDMLSQLELSLHQQQELEDYVARMETERVKLSKDCDRFQKKLKNMEVDVSISKSAEEQNKLLMEQMLEQKQISLDEKEVEISDLRDETRKLEELLQNLREENASRDVEHQLFVDQVAAKNKAYADLQAEYDSLQSMLNSLTRQQKEDSEAYEKLKNQLESSWGVNEELEALKQQVKELKVYQENFGNMQQKVASMEEQVHNKNQIIASLNEDLENASRAQEEVTTRSLHFEEASVHSAQQVEELRTELAKQVESESNLKEELDALKLKLEESAHTTKEQEQVIEGLKSRLKHADGECKKNTIEVDEMNRVITELNSKLELTRSREEMSLTEVKEKDQIIEDLNSQLALAVSKEEKNSAERDRTNHDMKSQIASLEMESSQKTQTIQDLNQTIQDLESRLLLADTDIGKLEEEKSQLEIDLLQYQGNSQVDSNANTNQKHLADEHDKLKKKYEELKREREKLAGEVADLRDASVKAVASSNDILESKIQEQERTIKELQAKLSSAESSHVYGGFLPYSEFNFTRSPLETTLSRARQTLTEKIQEKAAIEKELNLRRLHLERQQVEKQHLEDLLFEKKRFEQELHNQKELLQRELEDLEVKLQLRSDQDKSGMQVIVTKHQPKVN